jgi:ZipA, C-terminal FtsZ-binding domain
MNSLQAGLIGVSVLVIAIFAAWMWWQSWRNHRRTAAPKTAPATTIAHKATPMRADSVLGAEFDNHRALRSDPVVGGNSTLSNEAADSVPSEVAAMYRTAAPGPTPSTDTVPDMAQSSAGCARAVESIEVDEMIDDVPRRVANPQKFSAAEFRDEMGSAAPSTVSAATDASELAPKSASMLTTLPLDDRLNVYATIAASDGQAIDCQEFAPLADRSLAWGRVFRLSAWEYIEDLASGGAVQALCLGTPIASRAGPLQDTDALEWKRSVSAIADHLQLNVTYGGDVGVGARAAELDQFLAAADVICVLYLVRKDGGHWSGTRLRGTLEANGFRLQADGRFVYFEVESESPIFSAVDGFERSFTPERLRTENVTALRVVFEASNVINPVARFDVYRQTLRALARLLEADIKDSAGSNVGDDEFAALRADVLAGSTALAEAGIECGSPAAKALFR